MIGHRRRTSLLLFAGGVAAIIALPAALVGAQATESIPSSTAANDSLDDIYEQMLAATIRLPAAAALGAALALRPRRRGTPVRQPAVVQTQIILAVVGALIMLVVGASLARAFGIVGVASLIRYRSKIDDPKDAVVMLAALAVGLAAGVGLYALGAFATVFLVASLWIIEGFEPQKRFFDLTVKLGEETAELRPKVEAVLRRFKVDHELRTSAEQEVVYLVTAPLQVKTDLVSNALTKLAPDAKPEIKWDEKDKSKVTQTE